MIALIHSKMHVIYSFLIGNEIIKFLNNYKACVIYYEEDKRCKYKYKLFFLNYTMLHTCSICISKHTLEQR